MRAKLTTGLFVRFWLFVVIAACNGCGAKESKLPETTVSMDGAIKRGQLRGHQQAAIANRSAWITVTSPEEAALHVKTQANKGNGQKQESDETATNEITANTNGSSKVASNYSIGDSVEVKWSGSWYKATILKVEEDGKYKIHYHGYDDTWDELVGPYRVRKDIQKKTPQSISQIKRIPKKVDIVHQDRLHSTKESGVVQNNHFDIQCKLTYTIEGEKRRFQKGQVHIFTFGAGPGSWQNETIASLGFSEEQSILDYINLLDELYATPLKNDSRLQIELDPSDPRDFMRFGASSIKIAKGARGYYFWSDGFATDWISSKPGWKQCNIAIFRRTLAHVAKEAGLKVPGLPASMKQALEQLGQQKELKSRKSSSNKINNESKTSWSASEGGVLKGHTDVVRSVAFSPDGQTLASASDDNTVKIWDLQTGSVTHTLEGHRHDINVVAYSPDGKMLASGSDDNTINLWDPNTGTLGGVLKGHTNDVKCIAFSPNGEFLVSAQRKDGIVGLWDTQSGGLKRDILRGRQSWVNDIVFSPNGKSIACADGPPNSIWLWELQTRQRRKTRFGENEHASKIAYSPNGKWLFSTNGAVIKVWDSSTGKLARVIETNDEQIYDIAVSPNGETIVSSSGQSYLSLPHESTIKLWSVNTGELIGIRNLKTAVDAVAISPDGSMLAVDGSDGNKNTVSLFRIDKLEPPPKPKRLRPSFTGRWDIPSGPLDLSQQNNKVVGNYPFFNGQVVGVLSHDGMSVTGKWSQSNGFSGRLVFRLSADGNQIEGTRWSSKKSNTATAISWSGQRIGKTEFVELNQSDQTTSDQKEEETSGQIAPSQLLRPLKDFYAIEGAWHATPHASTIATTQKKNWVFEFDGLRLSVSNSEDRVQAYEYVIDTSTTPSSIDLYLKESDPEPVAKGIYQLSGDQMLLCIAAKGSDRPVEFEVQRTKGTRVFQLERKPATKPPGLTASQRLDRIIAHVAGQSGKVNLPAAANLILESANADDPRGEMWLAIHLHNGRGCFVKAPLFARQLAENTIPEIIKLANAGDHHAQLMLAEAYELGLGVEADHEEATKWNKSSWALGNVQAIYNLGRTYGKNTYGKARRERYRKAVELGHVGAAVRIATHIYEGNDCNKEPRRAIKEFKELAKKGSPEAMTALARGLNEYGYAKETSAARLWMRRAAEASFAGDIWQQSEIDNSGTDSNLSLGYQTGYLGFARAGTALPSDPYADERQRYDEYRMRQLEVDAQERLNKHFVPGLQRFKYGSGYIRIAR